MPSLDIRKLPVPPGHAALEYENDGTLFFAWDTNALDHSRWSVDDFEDAVLLNFVESGSPKTLDDLTILVAASRAKVYNTWNAKAEAVAKAAAQAAATAAAEKAAAEKAAKAAAERAAAERAAAEAAAKAAAEKAAAEAAERAAAEAAERAAAEAEAAERAAAEAEAAEKAAAEADRIEALLAPTQGVTLSEYAQAQIKSAEGVDRATILAALDIEPAVWAEASQGWLDRMQADSTSFIRSEFGRLYQEGVTDPRLLPLGRALQSTNQANLGRLHTDRTFVVELSAARSAANGAGLDGNSWLLENFGISPADLEPIERGSKEPTSPMLDNVSESDTERWRQLSLRAAAGDQGAREYIKTHMQGAANWMNLQSAFYDAYVRRFTAQMGGGVADDITF